MISDIRVGLRLLWKDKAFTLTAALTLALCIGANTALFSVVHNVLLRPLPVPESDRIVLMGNAYPGAGAGGRRHLVGRARLLRSAARDRRVRGAGALQRRATRASTRTARRCAIRVTRATPSFFRLLRVGPALGRTFTEQDGEVGNEKKVVLSYALWQSQFGGDPAAIGKDIRLDGQPYTVVGVMPKGFYFLNPDVMLWRPLAFTPQQKSDEQRHSNNFQNIARLKPGATHRSARSSRSTRSTRATSRRFPQLKPLLINAGFHTTVEPLQDTLVRDIKATLYLMWGGALFVLLIGCVNVANLVLVRSRARLKELATRLALGAGRWRVGAAAGHRKRHADADRRGRRACSSATRALRLLGTLNIQELPRGEEIRLDGVVVAYTLAVAAVDRLRARPDSGRQRAAGEPDRRAARGRPQRHRRPRRAHAAPRAGRGAGRRSRSCCSSAPACCSPASASVLAVEPGFNADGVLTASISLPRARYTDDAGADRLHARGAAAAARAARRHRRRRHRHDSVRRQQQRQRDLRRGLPDEAGRVGDLAERRST